MKRALLGILVIFFAAACAGNFQEMRKISGPNYKLAVEKFNAGDMQGALLLLKQAEDANPKDPEVSYGFALIYIRMGRLDDALKYADKTIKNGDKMGYDHPGMKSEGYNIKGTILYDMKKYDEAIVCFNETLKDDLYPTPEFTYYNLSRAYLKKGDLDNAETFLNKSLSRAPEYAPAWELQGKIYVSRLKIKEAIESFKKALSIFPGFIEAQLDLGITYQIDNNIGEAMKCFTKVMQMDEEGPYGRMARKKLGELGENPLPDINN